MCGCEDYDWPSVYRARFSRSRKDRRCCECGATIARGDTYVAISGCWDAEWSRFIECRKCDAMRQAWHDTEGCWASHGWLRDDVLDCLRGEARPVAEDDDEQRAKDARGAAVRALTLATEAMTIFDQLVRQLNQPGGN